MHNKNIKFEFFNLGHKILTDVAVLAQKYVHGETEHVHEYVVN